MHIHVNRYVMGALALLLRQLTQTMENNNCMITKSVQLCVSQILLYIVTKPWNSTFINAQ